MPKVGLGQNVWEASVSRAMELYEGGHRVVVSFSGGKDSGVAMEVCIEAARRVGRLPVEAALFDEEILLPGTFEYAERMAARKEVSMLWAYAQQPSLNFFNRENPLWWTFDPLLTPDEWVRKPPDFARLMPGYALAKLVRRKEYPPDDDDKETYVVVGIRATESPRRMMSIHSAGGHLTKHRTRDGVLKSRLIYDWSDGDIWLAYRKFGWDYNTAYDAFTRAGVPARRQRIAVPSLNVAGVEGLQVAARTWPKWYEKVCERLPGVRTAVMFGKSALVPIRILGETWEDTFNRVCLGPDNPEWIRDRANQAMKTVLKMHANHSTSPLPQKVPCRSCVGKVGSWEKLTKLMYMGDPVGMSLIPGIGSIHPSFFRPGAGGYVVRDDDEE